MAQVSLLWCVSWIGHELVEILRLPLPGNVAGLLLMFVALLAGVVPLRLVERGAGLLVGQMPLFFVPIAAGVMSLGPLLPQSGWAVLVVLALSTANGFVVTGHVSQVVAAAPSRSNLAPTKAAHTHRLDSR